ncbi:hypothetical protein R1sor_023213 [Riccia sorocarpa]|uniref:Reverse transcriptase/retrotransposon-derived protein RNase H-like domain-containing protein n=1 Tax=Riccia sorocarpa TaxID=122646 RepID=A0ABD3GQ21_9MARC
MCTLPQGATNSVAHMMAWMNKVLKDFIPEKTMPFLDYVPIKGCREDEKDEALDMRGCRKYGDCDIGHLCRSFGRKPDPAKVNAIQKIREDVKFKWTEKHAESMRKLKELLSTSPFLGRIDYQCGRPVILTVDTSPIAIGWAVGQNDAEGNRFAVIFGARVLSSRQRSYPQVKRELWGLVTAMKAEKEYLIGAEVVVETDCLPLLGMITKCTTADMTVLNWIAYIKTLNPEFRHIA